MNYFQERNVMNRWLQIAMLALFSALWIADGPVAAQNYAKKDTWRETLVANLVPALHRR